DDASESALAAAEDDRVPGSERNGRLAPVDALAVDGDRALLDETDGLAVGRREPGGDEEARDPRSLFGRVANRRIAEGDTHFGNLVGELALLEQPIEVRFRRGRRLLAVVFRDDHAGEGALGVVRVGLYTAERFFELHAF